MTTLDQPTELDRFAAARRAMIDSQLRSSGVTTDFVVAAMRGVAREDHVPDAARGYAYMDRAIKLENGRHLPAPLVQGRMLEEADPSPSDTAIVIDSGSGYLAALISSLAGTCHTLSPEQASGKGKKPKDASLLVIDGAIEELPAAIIKCLADGARVVAGLNQAGVTRLAVGRAVGGKVSWLPLAEMGIPVIPEFARKEGWSF